MTRGVRPQPAWLFADCVEAARRNTDAGPCFPRARRACPLSMKYLLPALAVVAMVCTVCATLTAVVFCLGMGANASPAEIRSLKLWMVGLSLLGLVGVVAGILLLRAGEHGWAAGAAVAPTVVIGVIFLVAMLK